MANVDTTYADARDQVIRALSALDIRLLADRRLPPLLNVLSKMDGVGAAIEHRGAAPVAWLRLDAPNGRVREEDGSRVMISDRLRALGDTVLAELREGKRRLVLDYSHEGRAAERRPFGQVEAILREAGIRPRRVAVLTQNAAAKTAADGLAAAGKSSFAVVLAHRQLAQFWLGAQEGAAAPIPPVGFAAQPTDARRYRYISLNYTIRPVRAMLVGRLLDHGAPGYLSFSTERARTERSAAKLLGDIRALSTPARRAENVARTERLLADRFETQTDIGEMKSKSQAVYQLPEEALRQSELFLVTETEMGDHGLRRFTEKTIKAIVAGIPFVIFGNAGTVAEMREIGFDVLDGVVDHSYDAVEDPAERFEAAWAESARLLDAGSGLVARHRDRIVAANAGNATAFRRGVAKRWIEAPLLELAAWASRERQAR